MNFYKIFSNSKKIISCNFELLLQNMNELYNIFFSYQNVGVIFLVLHHASEGVLHGARLIHFVDHKEKASKGDCQTIPVKINNNFVFIL